jgi:hypothetical protein
MRKPLSRPERDDCGTSQTSIRRHPPKQSAMREYAVAPIQYRGVAMRHVGPRDATWVPLPISTWTAPSAPGQCAPDRDPGGNQKRCINTTIALYDQLYGRNRERLAWGARGGNERPCSPARRRRHPDRMSLRRHPPTSSGTRNSPPPSGPEARRGHRQFCPTQSTEFLSEHI